MLLLRGDLVRGALLSSRASFLGMLFLETGSLEGGLKLGLGEGL